MRPAGAHLEARDRADVEVVAEAVGGLGAAVELAGLEGEFGDAVVAGEDARLVVEEAAVAHGQLAVFEADAGAVPVRDAGAVELDAFDVEDAVADDPDGLGFGGLSVGDEAHWFGGRVGGVGVALAVVLPGGGGSVVLAGVVAVVAGVTAVPETRRAVRRRPLCFGSSGVSASRRRRQRRSRRARSRRCRRRGRVGRLRRCGGSGRWGRRAGCVTVQRRGRGVPPRREAALQTGGVGGSPVERRIVSPTTRQARRRS